MSGRCGGGGGPGRLAAWPGWRPGAGRACLLDEARLAELERVLEAGPLAAGWTDQRWTLARFPRSGGREVRGAVHVPGCGTCCRRLSAQIGAAAPSSGRRRHRGGDPAWGQIKDGRGPRRVVVFGGEPGQSLRPPRSRTWARRGITRYPRPRRRERHVSVAGRPASGPATAAGCRRLPPYRAREGEPRRSPEWVPQPADRRTPQAAGRGHRPGLGYPRRPSARGAGAFTSAQEWLRVFELPSYAPDLTRWKDLVRAKRGVLADLAVASLAT